MEVRWGGVTRSGSMPGPGVRIVVLVIPGITSMAGRTSTQTGRLLVIISRTLALAASTRCSMVMGSIILSYFNILRICSIRF